MIHRVSREPENTLRRIQIILQIRSDGHGLVIPQLLHGFERSPIDHLRSKDDQQGHQHEGDRQGYDQIFPTPFHIFLSINISVNLCKSGNLNNQNAHNNPKILLKI